LLVNSDVFIISVDTVVVYADVMCIIPVLHFYWYFKSWSLHLEILLCFSLPADKILRAHMICLKEKYLLLGIYCLLLITVLLA